MQTDRRQTDDRQTDGWTMTYSEREREFPFAKNHDIFFFNFVTKHAFDRRTDGRTDRRTEGQTDIARPRLHSMQRGDNRYNRQLNALVDAVVLNLFILPVDSS